MKENPVTHSDTQSSPSFGSEQHIKPRLNVDLSGRAMRGARIMH